jgi:murein DD-endopeptidase MepM/ murein hydrolase activator NlpD
MPHDLTLPVAGTVLVAWGGDTPEQNHHHAHPVQKFAFDFGGVPSVLGQRYEGTGGANEDYFIFSRPVLCSLDGVVVEAVDGIRDNPPKQLYERMPSGNYVLIRHGDAVYSHSSHLKFGSVTVKAGDRVQRGQVVAQCGNSGRSTEPHLHFHLQSDDRTGRPTPLKCWFRKLHVGNMIREDYSPVRGDLVQDGFA